MTSPIINLIQDKVDRNIDTLRDYFNNKSQAFPAVIYNSVDLRHAGFKIAPVDTNCFPAGFNNITGQYQAIAKQQAFSYISNNFDIQSIKNIAIIAENHTRNLQYLASLNSLLQIFTIENIDCYICSLSEEIQDQINLQDANGQAITIHKIKKVNNQLIVNNQEVDLAILNNDLTKNYPEFFANLSTPIIPNPKIGWYNRSKFNHFEIYNNLCDEICQILDIDPWLISSIQSYSPNINFKDRFGFDQLADQVAAVLAQIQEKYRQYSIPNQPFCYIKADSGTYGMAVTQVFDAQEVLNLNKKTRNKMNMLKESTQNSSVKIQEGVPTVDTINGQTSEPLIYMIAGEITAFLSRCHQEKDQFSSLNSPGAQFFNIDQVLDKDLGGDLDSVKKTYWLVSKLASLSCSIEINNLN